MDKFNNLLRDLAARGRKDLVYLALAAGIYYCYAYENLELAQWRATIVVLIAEESGGRYEALIRA